MGSGLAAVILELYNLNDPTPKVIQSTQMVKSTLKSVMPKVCSSPPEDLQ